MTGVIAVREQTDVIFATHGHVDIFAVADWECDQILFHYFVVYDLDWDRARFSALEVVSCKFEDMAWI